jgi:diguanylate cyclase (GGDEF)-like protein
LEQRAKESMIQISLGMESEIRQITEEKKELEESALIDALTKLKNRTAYNSEVQGVVDYHFRSKKSFGIAVIDIDHFKCVNDTYGHAVGDTVLKQVGQCLQERCRNYDTVYRYGGEEFVAVVVDCDLESITIVANRFREAIESLGIAANGHPLPVTASVGVCWSQDGECRSIESLFSMADSYLYEAKKSGRNCCVIRRYAEAATVS